VSDTSRRKRASTGQDEQLANVVNREQPRLRSFIRRRVSDPRDVEDVLQDVFSALVEANRLLMPIDHITGWLYRVARNRITDLFRARTPESLELEELLPSSDASPEAEYARSVLLETLERAIRELPSEQRDVFIAHELEGRSFKEIAAATGVGVNTLLSRKRYAVLRLRERLRHTYDDMTRP
jgi:RNA polymerase sigma factor (sigma-70 family)